jgi:hypothetical protein
VTAGEELTNDKLYTPKPPTIGYVYMAKVGDRLRT